ncbi:MULTISPECIES: CDP-glycerol glycerophosphotransferase family protein [unclassified Shewanella]|uniref:CDP-glycerol glycerophosphotransferase family protein n=1 Tax=unclassified Shewanella TaxID=196818 RepID=UPI002004B8C6|nr:MULTISPECIES: CDP-glycerol glycerophosphotransferase family protein [unclassified Shewanella]MCK7634359.1 CDP-glycerol glycerophosphotransferase family protein [Shewanella sp. JNE17]MCK7649641.1 CDP-glycerol glycerophosphotransferase family protein [Shewanella sp. JNE8]MCK7657788.1 CDP-glycerol glycerophosphotransferase family protein [Shewanella sp. JNE4-2]UPO30002.1 CDP-glycerol glycerophosphotransferase family protein [Shewanella sp. JNE2]
MQKVFTFLRVIFGLLIKPVMFLLPVNNNIWVFGSWFGKRYSDNPKYLYEYVINNTGIKAYWIVKDRELESELCEAGVNAFYYLSLKGIWVQCRASMAFVSHSISSDLLPIAISPKCKRVQLWHGFPFKKIGYDDDKFSKLNRFGRRFSILFSYLNNDYYTIAVSSGEKCKSRFSTAFNLPMDRVLSLGFVRNDIFHYEPLFDKKITRKIIYMPTFRGEYNSYFSAISSDELISLNIVLKENDFQLDLRIHPANLIDEATLKALEFCENIKISSSDDIYESICDYDELVTDFSSVMFDFSILNKPVIFDLRGVEEYLARDRGVYAGDSFHCGSLTFKTWAQLFDILANDLAVNVDNNSLKCCVSANLEPGSCERTYMASVKLLDCI